MGWSLASKSRAMIVLAAALVLAGCMRDVAGGLDEMEANRGVVALARAGIESEKAADPSSEGHFRLIVARDDATAAISILAAEELPKEHPPAPQESSLVASPEADRAARIAGTAAQVERVLGSIDGVLDARVLLDIPVVDALSAALAPPGDASKKPRATASVLIRHRGTSPPVPPDDLRRLVAGAVSGLAVEDVAVVLIAVPATSLTDGQRLAYLGPVAVSRSSIGTLRAVAVGVFVLLTALSVALLVLLARLRRVRDEAAAPPVPAPARSASR